MIKTWIRENRMVVIAVICAIGVFISSYSLVSSTHMQSFNSWLHKPISELKVWHLLLMMYFVVRTGDK